MSDTTEIQSMVTLLREQIQAVDDVTVLDDLQQQITKLFAKRREELAREADKLLMSHARELALKHGLSVSELLARISQQSEVTLRGEGRAARGTGERAPRVAPKYRNPLNPEQTWSGRGVKPRWFKEALAQGYTLQDMEIPRGQGHVSGEPAKEAQHESPQAHEAPAHPHPEPEHEQEASFLTF